MQSARLSLVIINDFQMTGLLRRSYYLKRQETKYVSIYFNNDDLKQQVKIGTSSGHAVLNEIQWFIVVTFKSDIAKNEGHEIGELQHTLSVYCGRYIRITSENTQAYLSKKDWSQLMDLASGCIDREVIKFGRIQDELQSGAVSILNPNPFVPFQTQMLLISMHCGMNQSIETFLFLMITKLL
jgi:hypothetical protein